ncbi:MAG: DUF983 domain-containing protein [Pirellulales bacterium]
MASHDPSENASASLPALLWRAIRLRCPACGRAPIFSGWFRMYERCGHCDRKFNRDPGYMLGSIYFNYGVTAMIVLVVYFSLYFSELLSPRQRLVALAAFCVVFPTWFFRYARALWMAFDELFDPWPNDEERRAAAPRAARSEP